MKIIEGEFEINEKTQSIFLSTKNTFKQSKQALLDAGFQ
jgi:hypothetical protein